MLCVRTHNVDRRLAVSNIALASQRGRFHDWFGTETILASGLLLGCVYWLGTLLVDWLFLLLEGLLKWR